MDLKSTLIAADVHRENLLIVTGAGMSVASGLSAFRSGANAIWDKSVTEMATLQFFERDPVASWKWYHDRFGSFLAASPNVGHLALAALERSWVGSFTLVTQNIDCLHEAAGSKVIKCHGSSDRVRCSRSGCVNGAPSGTLPIDAVAKQLSRFQKQRTFESLPRCPACRGLLRPHVLWFDELYIEHEGYGLMDIEHSLRTAQVAFFVGTSFSVGITYSVIRKLDARKVPWFVVDPNFAGIDGYVIPEERIVREPQERFLPTLVAGLYGR